MRPRCLVLQSETGGGHAHHRRTRDRDHRAWGWPSRPAGRDRPLACPFVHPHLQENAMLTSMLTWLMKRRLDAFERDTGYDASYVREMLDADVKAMMTFFK